MKTLRTYYGLVENVFRGVVESKIDHVAIQTAYCMIPAATRLFENLGFSIDPKRNVEGSWGKAIFLTKKGSLPIQLTDSSNPSPIPTSENHVGIVVDDPETVAYQIRGWVEDQWGKSFLVQIDEVAGEKYFVSIPEILTISLELVPSPTCPDCHGNGTVRRGREGQGFDYDCQTCRGTGKKMMIN